MAAEIEGRERKLLNVFSNDYEFAIPKYQRPYSWSTIEAEELLDDLLNRLEESDDDVSNLSPYFLGSVVLIKAPEQPASEVVDGQQRLTTLTILLAALKTVTGGDFATSLNGHIFQVGNAVAGTKDRPRLMTRDRDQPFFRKVIQDSCTQDALAAELNAVLPDSQRKMAENAALFLRRLEEVPAAKRQRLASFMILRCFLVVVSTPDLKSAFRIFQVLNDRGLNLSQADILKAELIGEVSADKQDALTIRWEDAEDSLGQARFSDLFSHLRMIVRRMKASETILEEFRTHVVPKYLPAEKLIDEFLLPYAESFGTILSADYKSAHGAESVNKALKWLNRIDNSDWIPPAMVIVRKFNQDPSKLATRLWQLECLSASMMIRRVRVNDRIDRFGKVIAHLEKGDPPVGSKLHPLELSKYDKFATAEALDEDIYTEVPAVRQYILLRLDEALSQKEATYMHGRLTIEHVLPQTVSEPSPWYDLFPDEAVRVSWVHRLANLVILTRSKNSQASNFPFDKKKTQYFQSQGGVSTFALTTQVLSEPIWDLACLERRQAALLNALKGVWGLDD